MSFDGLVTRALVHECRSILLGGRITKIYQPSEVEILLHIRSQGKNHKLLLSAHPTYPRIQFTEAPADNPKEPPTFCMLLRKHAEGGLIQAVEQVGLERIVHLDFRTRDELGDEVVRRLIIEIMGRHSNIILVDPVKGTVLDAIRRVSHAVSQHRQVFPGALYVAPPAQHKSDPLYTDFPTFIAGFDYNQGRLDQQLMNRFTGIGPLAAKEIVAQAGLGGREQLWNAFDTLMNKVRHHQYEPSIIQTGEKAYFYLWPLASLPGEVRTYPTMSECLESYYHGKAERDRVRQQTHDLLRKLRNELEKNEKKIEILERELADSERADEHRIYGELLTTYMHQVRRGDQQLQVVNYYQEEAPEVTIPLDPLLTPSENAQRYFKRYNKVKASKKWNLEQIEKTRAESQYLESVLVQLENSTLREVEQIREELEEEGWLKSTAKKALRKKKEKPTPTTAHASDGTVILIGRNNKQNDALTHQIATSTDTWLHTKEIPGSHVVIRSREVSPIALQEAAILAAYFSKARESSQVPVDFTLIKHVKKPTGARPGFVTYDHQQTLYVTPDEEKVRKLLSGSARDIQD